LHALEHVEIVRLHRDDRQLLRLGVELDRKNTQLGCELVRDQLEQRVVDRCARKLLRRHEVSLVEIRLKLEQGHLVEQPHLDQGFLDMELAALGEYPDRLEILRFEQTLGHERIEQLGVHARSPRCGCSEALTERAILAQ
jgi:hypothetical protein